MQDAETLLSISGERGKRGLPLRRVYPLLYNPELYLRAYTRLYANKGAMTRGATRETVDGMSRAKIDRLIDELRHEHFRWTPVRRVHIPKKNGKLRPLGVPTWTDKLLQEVLRSILEAYFEPQFSAHSHGFRPNRGCHTCQTAKRPPRSGSTLVDVLQPVQYRPRPDATGPWAWPQLRRLQPNCSMWLLVVVVPVELGEYRPEVLLVEDNQVVEALSAKCPDDSFNDRVRAR